MEYPSFGDSWEENYIAVRGGIILEDNSFSEFQRAGCKRLGSMIVFLRR
jgi:hypothetical protein